MSLRILRVRSSSRRLLLAVPGALALFGGVAHASDVLVVDAAGGGSTYTTIQDAVVAAEGGDIVLLRSGSYTEEVTVLANSLTIVADGPVAIVGHLFVRNLGADQTLLVSGVALTPPVGGLPGDSFYGALDAVDCDGRIRLQDCVLQGALGEGHSPYTSVAQAPGGGAGAFLVDCADVSFVDCDCQGGDGANGIGMVSGDGGSGVLAHDSARVTLVRTVVQGGDGGVADNPDDGGHGVHLEGATELHVADSSLTGGAAGCWSGFGGSPTWGVDGGNGLNRAAGTMTWNFESEFHGGFADQVGGCATPSFGGNYGLQHSGQGGIQSNRGYPNALNAPALVRHAQPWTLGFAAEPGESLQLFHGSQTTFAFALALEQPRLVGGADVRRHPTTFIVPPNGMVQVPLPPLSLPAASEGYVHWFQGHLTDPTGGGAFSNSRAIIFLNAGF